MDVKSEDEFALRGKALKEALETDLARGKKPFIVSKCALPTSLVGGAASTSVTVVATVGTTSSGAIDAIDEIGEVCKYAARDSSSRGDPR